MCDFSRRLDEDTNRDSEHFVPKLADHLERLPEHTIIVFSDEDLPFAEPDAKELVAAIQAKNGSVEQFVESNADHYQANRSFVDPTGIVAGATAKMMGLR